MATVTKWTPFGVALNVTATAGTVTRTSATQFSVVINVSWKCYWSGNKTNYGMRASSGSVTNHVISSFGTSRASGSSSFTATYSISGYGAQTKSITVTFNNFNKDNGNSATKALTLSVSVPAWPSYKISYNANGGSGAPAAQTKYKNATLTLSSTKPTRTGYTFKNWNTASGGGGTSYASGASYTANAAATLYAQWTAKTYTITFNANGGSGGPSTATKTYGKALTLPTTTPTRTNYNFLGWAETSGATAAAYTAGGTYSKSITANTTLYAVWELAYYAPVVKNLSVGRCDQDGTANDFGTYFKAEFEWECCQLVGSNHVKSITIGYRLKEDASYTTTTVTASGTASGSQSHVLGGSLSPDSAYDILVTVADSSSNSPNYANAGKRLSSSAYVMDIKKGGKGISFGKAADQDGFDLNWNALFRKDCTMANNAFLGTHNAAGEWMNAFGMNDSGNLLIGWGLYNANAGNSILYGKNVRMNAKNDAVFIVGSAGGAEFRPYFRKGDSFTLDIRTSGYVTNNKAEVWFFVPLAKPVIGSPTVTASSPNDGLIIRQGGNYTHGSSASAFAKPNSYTTGLLGNVGIRIKATMSTLTNAVNNDTCGVYWSGTITFS